MKRAASTFAAILFGLLLCAQPASAAYTYIGIVTASASGTSTATTGSVDSSTADLAVAVYSFYAPGGTPSVSDSKSNTWNDRTTYSGGNRGVRVSWTQPGTFGTGHTFSLNAGGCVCYPTIAVMLFSGSQASTPFDAENGDTSASHPSPWSTGSVTPSASDELMIAGMANDFANTATIDSSYTATATIAFVAGVGMAAAYKIKTGSAAAENPQWSWSGGNTEGGVTNLAFKVSGGAPPATTHPCGTLLLLGVGCEAQP